MSHAANGPLLDPERRRRLLLGAPAVAFLLLFFVVPLVENALVSVRHGGGYDFAGYAKLFSDTYYLDVIWTTLRVSLVVTLLCALVGYPIAYHLVRRAGRWSGVLIFLLIAPLLTSIIMRTFGWQVLLGRAGVVNAVLNGLGLITRPQNYAREPIAVYIGLVHVLIPFMILSISAVLQGIDRRLEESARILGAGKIRTFLEVTLPLSIEGVGTGCILVFMLTNGSFVTMLLLGGGNVVTLPLLIYQQFNLTQDVAFASAMGNVLLLFALACLFLQLRLVRRRGGV